MPRADELDQHAPPGHALAEAHERLRLRDVNGEGVLGRHLLHVPGALRLVVGGQVITSQPITWSWSLQELQGIVLARSSVRRHEVERISSPEHVESIVNQQGAMGFKPDIRPDDELTAAELTATFQCQQGKGMRCSKSTNSLVLVVDHTHKHAASIYADEWDEAGVLHYRGTGLRGDQSLEYEGNRWLRDAEANGTGVFLFDKTKSGRYVYQGRVTLVDEAYRRREPDVDGQARWVWVFPLRLVAEAAEAAQAAAAAATVETQRLFQPTLVSAAAATPSSTPPPPPSAGETSHDEVQWRLLEMGALLGLDVWVARNDRSRSFEGRPFLDTPRLRESLPRQFEAEVMSLIQHIDVLWLRGNRVEAAFEIEHTTSVYSGLLRMADLVTLHPNILIRLYIVAPDSRRTKVLGELVRPTFDALEPPLRNICGFIPYSSLFREAETVRRYRDQLKPGFLNGIAEYAPSLQEGYRTA